MKKIKKSFFRVCLVVYFIHAPAVYSIGFFKDVFNNLACRESDFILVC